MSEKTSLQVVIDAIMEELDREPVFHEDQLIHFAPVLRRNLAGAAVRAIQNAGWGLLTPEELEFFHKARRGEHGKS